MNVIVQRPTQDAENPATNLHLDLRSRGAEGPAPLHLGDLSRVSSGPDLDLQVAPHVQTPLGNAAPAKKHLDVAAFGQALHARLKSAVAGYAMQLRQGGSTIYTLQWNWARRPGEGSLGWNPDRLMHIASLSKLMTGIAMARLLDEKGLSPDTKIIGYLPDYWQKGPLVNQVSFRHLMTHTSGFVTGASVSDYVTMRNRVALGSGGVGNYSYENMNYGLCVVLTAVLTGDKAKSDTSGPLTDLIWSLMALQSYDRYVQQKVFAPAGVSSATLSHPSDCALAYAFPGNGSGWDSGPLGAQAGGTGWHMSIRQVLDVMDAFRRRGSILPTAKATAALEAKFGLDVVSDTPAGRLYNKNGRWTQNDSETEQSLAYFLPEDMELVVFANSFVDAPPSFFRKVVSDLYLSHLG